ncbi:MAG: hypothetical protein K0Q76_1579 [Panacagrimonas sp.]|nr:hypothetical protein [Panacagrimonas sp.]MCC2656471.1 hypothetical protein [Panacagrimonas sp.]
MRCVVHAVRILALLCLPLLLHGCATVQSARDPIKSSSSKSAGADGTVFASVTVNTGEIAAFDAIYLERIQDTKNPLYSKSYLLRNISGGQSRDTALFVGDLPAGDYRLLQLDAPNNKYLAINDAQAKVIGSFRVESGKVSDLGRLVLTAINIKVILGRSPSVLDNRELVAQLAPGYVGAIQGKPAAQGWNTPRQESDIAEEYAKVYPIGTGGLSELPSGEVLAGSRMGVVLARNTEGRWRVLSRTGRLDAVLYTTGYAVGDNVAVVVGDVGTLMRIDKSGKAHDIPPGNLPFGANFFVDHSPDHSTWFVGVQTSTTATLYQSLKLESGTWTAVRSDTIEASAWSGGRGVWMWRGAGGVGFASTESGKVDCYDYATKAWRSTGVPDGRRLIALAGGPGPAVGVLTGVSGGFAGVFAKTHYAPQCGGAWVETDSPYKVKMSPPIVVPSGSIIEGGGAFGDKGLYRSTDRGKTWIKVTSDVTVFNDRLWVLPRTGLFAISTGAFGIESVEHSGDDGQTWKLELTSINRQILDRQLKK